MADVQMLLNARTSNGDAHTIKIRNDRQKKQQGADVVSIFHRGATQ